MLGNPDSESSGGMQHSQVGRDDKLGVLVQLPRAPKSFRFWTEWGGAGAGLRG